MHWFQTSENPQATLASFIDETVACGNGGAIGALRFDFRQYYLAHNPVLELLAVLAVGFNDRGSFVRVLVTDQVERAQTWLDAEGCEDENSLWVLARALQVPIFDLGGPLRLHPIAVPKPWGREIWYTGIEQRGQSLVGDGAYRIPLPWLLSVLPQRVLGSSVRELHLLKILDPLSEPVYGDLYFELHEKKQEVYVITDVNEGAWPGGCGGIRFGFDTAVRAQYGSDAEFRQGFLTAVKGYEQVRREIDAILDRCRQEENVGLHAPVDARTVKRWQQNLPEHLVSAEQSLREAMNRFTGFVSLRVGDVLKVPCLTPHALQHGVRAVEFQTPVYERKILSFAQKVLTQTQWDTAEAVEMMALESPPADTLAVIEDKGGARRESIVQFDDFRVERITLAPGARWVLPSTGQYCLLMAITGHIEVSGATLAREEAVLVPARRESVVVNNHGDRSAVALLSLPTTDAGN